MPQAGPGVGLGRVPRGVRAGLAGEGARGDFAAAQVTAVGVYRSRPSWPRRRREKPIGGRLPRDRLLTVDCGQLGRALWTGAHVMDWR